MGVVLIYTKVDGLQDQVEFEKNVSMIDLRGKHITKIDLNTLSSCSKLKKLELDFNHLQTINLSPLRSCRALKRIELSNNQLQTIDLSPISSCIDLQELSLNHNELHTIDLAPLSSCANLRELGLSMNQLQTIDLRPLGSCNTLQTLSLGGNQMQAIDLAPLSSCNSLQELWLRGNSLNIIDLSPLICCTSLHELALERNQLRTIDLAPLASCISLQNLVLNDNQLKTIDLTPLSSCTFLQRLILSGNQLRSIDLTPLSSCTSLQELELLMNPYKTIDLTPLFSSINLHKLKYEHTGSQASLWLSLSPELPIPYERPTQTYPWSFLYGVAEHHERNMRVQQDILYALGLGEYGFIDTDLRNTFTRIAPETPLHAVRETIGLVIVNQITIAIDQGRATTDLDISKHYAEHWELAMRTQRTLDLRKSEIQNVQVGISSEGVNLQELYLTAYGYEVLTALGMRLMTTEEEFGQVVEVFRELGFKLKTGNTPISGVLMSDGLREAIWWIIENRGKPWKEIKQYPDFGDEFDCI